MSRYANAGTAVICNPDFRCVFLDQYSPHCIGIYLCKYAHTPLQFKIALTKDSLCNKDRCIRQLPDNISEACHETKLRCQTRYVDCIKFVLFEKKV